MNTFLIFIFLIIIGEFCIEKYLLYRNVKAMSNEIPNEVEDLYDSKTYKKQQSYQMTNTKFSILKDSISTLFILVLFGFCFYGDIFNYASSLTDNMLFANLITMVILLLIPKLLISIPFGIYDTFVIEQKFGFNKTTPLLFIKDTVISCLMSIIISGFIFTIVYLLYEWIGLWFILGAFVFTMLFQFIMVFLYSDIIVPLFNKQTKLEDGVLRRKILALSNRIGFDVKDIYVLDASKRTTKANAYFTSFGSKKRIVLYDTLINDLTTNEILAVLIHEIGHYKHKHILKSFITSGIDTLLSYCLFGVVLTFINVGNIMGNLMFSFLLSYILFDVLSTPLKMLSQFIENYVTRRHEYEADNFVKEYGYSTYLISSLKILSKKTLSNLTPDKWFVKFNYSHPTLVDRIRNLEKI